MNKLFLIGLVVVIAAGAGIYLISQDAPDQMMEKENVVIEKTDEVMKDKQEEVAMEKKGSYEPYSAEKLSRATDGKVVLFFRASWCPTCRTLDANLKSNLNQIPAGVTILDVDYDASTALKQKYGVTYQHTLVQVDASGKQIAKWTSSPTLSDILAHLK